MNSLFVLGLDRDLAGHLFMAVRCHRAELRRRGWAEPPALAELQEVLMRAREGQEGPGGAPVDGWVDDSLHAREFLTIDDVVALTGAGRTTVKRWIRTGALPSANPTGRCRRVLRRDLDTFLSSAGRGVASSGQSG